MMVAHLVRALGRPGTAVSCLLGLLVGLGLGGCSGGGDSGSLEPVSERPAPADDRAPAGGSPPAGSRAVLEGCSGGGNSGSLSPASEPTAPAGSRAASEQEATKNLVTLYCTAILQEDIDRLQALLEADGGAFQGGSVLDAMSATFRSFAVTDLELRDVAIVGAPMPQAVTFQEALSVIDPEALDQRTQVGRTRWQLGRRVGASGVETILIAGVMREGPQFEVVIRGRAVAGQPVRVVVRETTGTFTIAGGAVAVPETGAVQALALAAEGRWQAVVTLPGGPNPEPLRVQLQGQRGEAISLSHRYRVRATGAGVVQRVAGTEGISVHAVAVTPDGGVWAGGEAKQPKAIGTLVQVAADGHTLLRTEQPGLDDLPAEAVARIEALTLDQLGRLHALFIARVGQLEGVTPGGVVASGDVVLDPAYPDLFCQTVNVVNPAYPLRVTNPQTGTLQASASTRAVAAGGGDVWLFGSDGGVARVADAFRGGQCPAEGAGVRYEPIFRREAGGLLANTVPAFRVGADGALWFGTAVGLTRLVGQQFTPALFEPALAVGGEVATLEAFFREVAAALFAARPLTTVRVGDVSLEERFGRPLVKEDLIFSLAEDGPGRLWVGTLGGGLRRVETRGGGLQDTLPRPLTRQEGLGSNLILALAVGPDGSVWAATEEGVSRIREVGGMLAITAFSPLDGLPTPVWDVAVAPNGMVWLATDGGLFQLLGRGGVVRGMVVDAQGRPVAGAEVVGVGTPFRAVTDAQGQFVLVDLPPGPYQLVVDGSLASGGPFTAVSLAVEVTAVEQTLPPLAVAPRPPAARLVKVAGDGQMGMVGRPLPQPLVVQVIDGQGTGITGVPVSFTVTQGGGALAPVLGITDASGRASTAVTLAAAGVIEVTARADGLAAVFTAAAAGGEGAARLVQVSGDNQIGVPGEELPEPLVVRLLDQFGTPVAGEPVTATITEGDGTLRPLAPEASEGCGEPVPAVAPQAREVSVATDPAGQARFCLRPGETESVTTEARSLDAEPVTFEARVDVFACPRAIAKEDNETFVVVSCEGAVLRANPTTGAFSVVSGLGRGAGPSFIFPQGIAVEADGASLVVDPSFGGGAVVRVNPTTGDRTVLSGCTEAADSFTCLGPVRGSGPLLAFSAATGGGIAVEAPGTLVVTMGSVGTLLRVDPITGNRTVVSGCREFDLGTGTCVGGVAGGGPLLRVPTGIAVEANGTLVVIDPGSQTESDGTNPAVVRVDPVSGDRTVISGCPAVDGSSQCVGAIIGTGPLLLAPTGIAVEAIGTLVVVDPGSQTPLEGSNPAVVRVDPITGDRTLVSGRGRGSGDSFRFPEGIAVEANRTLVVTDFVLDALVRVDPGTGDRTVIAGLGRGSGPRIFPEGIAVEANGSLVVTDRDNPDPDSDALVRVDPSTGDRTILSRCTSVDTSFTCVDSKGAGEVLLGPRRIAVEADGGLVVTDLDAQTLSGNPAVVRVDPITGDRTLVSGRGRGTGDSFEFRSPAGIAVEGNGALVVAEDLPGAVVRVNPVTGRRTQVSGPGRGTGDALRFVDGIAVEPRGTLVVTSRDNPDSGLHAVVRVDPITGDRDLVSGPGRGTGPPFVSPTDIAVEADGALVVTDRELRAVVRVDPVSGNRTIVSDATTGTGPPFVSPTGIAVEADGALVVTDSVLVVRVDPTTGDRTIVSK